MTAQVLPFGARVKASTSSNHPADRNVSDEAREAVIGRFEQTRHWRSEKAVQYPNDRRNQEAVELLDSMIATASEISDELLIRMEKLFRIESANDGYGVNRSIEAAGLLGVHLNYVGFYSAPATASTFLESFLDEAERSIR